MKPSVVTATRPATAPSIPRTMFEAARELVSLAEIEPATTPITAHHSHIMLFSIGNPIDASTTFLHDPGGASVVDPAVEAGAARRGVAAAGECEERIGSM